MSSNVIQTTDQTGKLKFQNLDSAFNGKYEDLLTLGKGEVKTGVVISEPVKEIAFATADKTVKVSGACKALLVTATATGCTVDISELEIPVGATFYVLVEGGENVTISGLGIDTTTSGLQFFLKRADGTLYYW